MEEKENDEYDLLNALKLLEQDENEDEKKDDESDVSFLQDIKHILGIKENESSNESPKTLPQEYKREDSKRSNVKKYFFSPLA